MIDKISDKVKEIRKSQGMTQSELAMVSGVGIRFIVDLESGKPSVQMNKVLNVLEALGLELEIKDK